MKIQITLENTSDSDQTLLVRQLELPFVPSGGARITPDNSAGLIIQDEKFRKKYAFKEGCWRREVAVLQPVFDWKTFAPGEGTSKEYYVYNSTKNEACWPPGTYRFTHPYRVRQGKSSELNPSDNWTSFTEYRWKFDLIVQ